MSVPQKPFSELGLEKGNPPLEQPYYGRDAALYLTTEYLRGGEAGEPIKPGRNAVYVGDGETIVLWDGANAGEVFRARKGVLSSTMTRVTHDNSLDPDYFFYAVKRLEPLLKARTAGSGIPHVDKEMFGRLTIAAFDKTIQTKIATILSLVDGAMTETEALIAKQRRITNGLMQDLFSAGVDQDGKLRSSAAHCFKKSALGTIPVDWDTGDLRAEFVTSGSRGWARHYAPEGAIFLRIGNLTREDINLRLDAIVRVKPPKSLEVARTAVHPGDILISITADLGIIGVIPDGFPEAYINQHIALVRLAHSEANPRFIAWFLCSRLGQMQFQTLNESGAKAGLTLPMIRKLRVPLLNPTDQQRIADILDSSANETTKLRCSYDKLNHLKIGLMQELLPRQPGAGQQIELEASAALAS